MPFLTAAGHRLAYERIEGGKGPTLVFLHEGLGSVELWRDVPARIAAATGLPAFVYSRWGNGHSDPVTRPRPLTYMHDEARATLPAVLDHVGIEEAVLIGHSDGASIALIHAAEVGARVVGLILEAPHVFVEDRSVASIADVRARYATTDLRDRLARRHADVDGAFFSWADAWLDPDFRGWNLESLLPAIRVPTLVIQAKEDPYGTLAQVDAITRQVRGPVSSLILEGGAHAPHRDQPERVLDAMRAFLLPWCATR